MGKELPVLGFVLFFAGKMNINFLLEAVVVKLTSTNNIVGNKQ